MQGFDSLAPLALLNFQLIIVLFSLLFVDARNVDIWVRCFEQ